jgi:chromate transporter
MHRELVERRGWIAERAFLRALNFCTLLPGPEAQQLATYVGWRLHGIAGGIVAGAFFVIPSIFVLLVLSYAVAAYGDVSLVSGLLYGVQPVVVAIVLDALIRIGRRTLRAPLLVAFAVAAYLALQVAGLPFPAVIAVAALAGIALRRALPASGDDAPARPASAPRAMPSAVRRAALILLAAIALWAVPVGALVLARGADDVLVQEALFFTQAAFVTFGGAYAVLAYVSDAAVHAFGWLSDEQMVQGLGLAESTPGPLIMVLQYVGFLGAWKLHPEAALLNGTLGALITTYTTFLPSFTFVLLAAPYVERLGEAPRLRAALAGVTAAVVGVIARLATVFGASALLDGARVDLFAAALAAVAFALLRRTSIPIPVLILAGAALGAVWKARPL